MNSDLPRLPYSLAVDSGLSPDEQLGLRLSTQCAAQRLLDLNKENSFSKGISERGHALAEMFIERVIARSVDCIVEYEVPWCGNLYTGHIDCLVDEKESEYYGPWELKSHIDCTQPTPSEISQLKRYLWALRKQGKDYPYGHVAIINPSNLRVHGPFRVFLTDADIERYDREEQLTYEIITNGPDDVTQHPNFALLCSCGLCTKTGVKIDMDESPELRELAFQYACKKSAGHDEEELAHLRHDINNLMQEGWSAKSEQLNITVSKSKSNKKVTYNWKGALEAGVIPSSVVEAMRINGYVSDTLHKGTLRIRT